MQVIRRRPSSLFIGSQHKRTVVSFVRTGVVLTANEELNKSESYSEYNRPFWFIFPGLGAQRNHVPKEIWSMEPFMESMRESNTTLRNLGHNLDELMNPNNDRVFVDIRSAFAALSAVQMALYDTLLSVFDTQPSGFIGHSAGELTCAYADGCLTAEEVLAIGDARGRAMQEGRSEQGAMAAVGMSWNDMKNICPSRVYPACNNSSKNITISGSLPSVVDFVRYLQHEGVFAKVVDTCNYSPHCPLAGYAADLFRRNVEGIVRLEKPRSERWICTSVLEDSWHLWNVSHCSGEYFVRSFLKPVWFFEALSHIPNGAIVAEVSPSSVFQGILKQSVGKDCAHFAPILRDGTVNPVLSSSNVPSLLVERMSI